MDRFLHISSQHEGVAGLEMPTDVAQKHLCCRWIKIADGASQKQYQECLIRPATSHGFLKSFQIRCLQPDDADCTDVSQFLVAFDEGRSGYVDGEIGHWLSIGERFQYPTGFSATATPQLEHCHGSWKMFEHVSGMAAEEALLGTSQPIFG